MFAHQPPPRGYVSESELRCTFSLKGCLGGKGVPPVVQVREVTDTARKGLGQSQSPRSASYQLSCCGEIISNCGASFLAHRTTVNIKGENGGQSAFNIVKCWANVKFCLFFS